MGTMIQQMEDRFNGYLPKIPKKMNMDLVLSKAKECNIWMFSYEHWIDSFSNKKINKILAEFYEKTKFWNGIEG